MSTKAERAGRVARKVLPLKVRVRQSDGSFMVQRVPADVRVRKARRAVRVARDGD